MSDRLKAVIGALQADPDLDTLSEAETSQSVRRVFNGLGWDADNRREVKPEYAVSNRRVDYALLHQDAPQVFVEVKKGSEPLERHQEQLLDYAFKQGIRLAVLTNGSLWWFYLPLQPGSWEQRRCCVLCIDDGGDTAALAELFATLLSKTHIAKGSAFDSAAHLYQKTQRQRRVTETLPKAWNRLIDELDGLIVARIAEMTGEICGHEPTETEVETFLSEHLKTIQIDSATETEATLDAPTAESMRGRKIRAFTFNGKRREVHRWIDYLIEFCSMLNDIDAPRFEKVLTLRGRGGRIYFSKDKNAIKRCRLIPNSDIYADRDASAESTHCLVGQIARHLSYPKPTVETIKPP